MDCVHLTLPRFHHMRIHWVVGTLVLANEQKTWCVAKPSSDSKTLEENINYACSQVDCRILQKGCTCSSPDNLMNHASIAMNLYYQAKGRNHWNCHFGNSALIVLTDPSVEDAGWDRGLVGKSSSVTVGKSALFALEFLVRGVSVMAAVFMSEGHD
ncbi:putative glucan endo-1,3-beta-glucosidase-like isoform X1 [Capsicum annuum]|nr:putative glucan endo-1,3-beta-glucosidase-like isoform X1 [Capsicum annuum]